MKYPTEAHQNYLQYAENFAKINEISLLVKGSVATDTATPYSDIDILMLCNEESCIDEFILAYRPIVMSNRTLRPKGILIVVYDNGICVDIDVRKTITSDEIETAVVLNDSGVGNKISLDAKREEELLLNTVPEREEWYQLLRLFHRSLIKYLSGKRQAGCDLLDEIREALQDQALAWTGMYKADIEIGLNSMCSCYSVPNEIKGLLQDLIDQIS